MVDQVENTLVIGVVLIVLIGLVLFFLRGKIKRASVKLFGMSGQVETHEPVAVKKINDIDQYSGGGDNSATIKGDNIHVDRISQDAKGNNSITIGNS